jgi:hypothetical protein
MVKYLYPIKTIRLFLEIPSTYEYAYFLLTHLCDEEMNFLSPLPTFYLISFFIFSSPGADSAFSALKTKLCNSVNFKQHI